MKRNLLFTLSLIIATAFTFLLFQGCSKDDLGDKKTETYTIYSPVYKDRAEVLAAINGASSTPVEHAGKLYIKDNFLYLNDIDKGIHIFDNSDPAHPVQIAFLSIPGNLDIAIKGNILYADMYSDLLALDISDPGNARITSTLSNFFTGRTLVYGHAAMNDQQIAVSWNTKDTTVFLDDIAYPDCNDCGFLANAAKAGSSTGTAGSMAAMVIMNNYLYAISEMHSLGIVDISNPSAPEFDSSYFAGFDLQTIFPFEDKLFLGSAVGMFMYDVSDPQHPVSIGQFEHGRACDPVIADGDYAYVTLHAGTNCGGEQNELDVIDIKDITNSKLVKTYNLTKPTGLSKDGDLLFVCDGTAVKIYDAADPLDLKLLQQIETDEPYDAIAADKNLVVVAADGLYQYDYGNINNIRQLSFIAAKK